MAEDKPVTIAAVAGAHGVTGEVRLKLFGEGVDALSRFKSFNDGALTLKKLRSDNKGGAIARFAEIADRNAAEKLRGTAPTVLRSALPPLEEGEYYHADLRSACRRSPPAERCWANASRSRISARAMSSKSRSLDGKRFMVPMREEAVPEWSDPEGPVIDAAFAE